MTRSSGPISSGGIFVGREQELTGLNEAAADSSVRIICVYGDRGAGKTTIASQIFYHHRDAANIFDSTDYLSAHGTSEEVLLDELYRTLSAFPQRSYTPSELPSLLRAQIETQTGDRLVFIDNVEDDVIVGELFVEFLRMLIRTKNRCALLLTSRTPLPGMLGKDGWRAIHLQGIREPAAVLSILGDALRHRHSPQDLLEMTRTVGRLPQRLLYCRWAQPDDIQAFAQRFAQREQPLSLEALRQVLSRLSDPRPLLACGVLRGTDIRKGLLAWLTRSLGDPSSTDFDALLDELFSHRLVASVAGSGDDVRLHPDTHVDLMRLCEQRGTAWVRICRRAAWKYYHVRCVDNPDDVSAVGELVHHGLALGNFDGAYASVFDNSRVEGWRQQALSIRIEPILKDLLDMSRISSVIATQERRAKISVAMANISSDLGRPRLCLEHLTAAQQYLDGIPRSEPIKRTLRGLWMQMAISHANLGDTARCIEHYRRVINSDDLVIETATALCMGYLGYEYCDYKDFASAHYWTQKALDSCPRERSPQVFSKNLSNRGLVFYYEGNIHAASAHLQQAVELVRDPSSPAYDIRECGRAMSHFAMVELARGRPAVEVNSLLERSLALTEQAGDVRRIATTEGRIGIVAGLTGGFDRAESLLHRAIVSHHKVGDLRNMIFELLTLLGIRHLRIFGSCSRTMADLERASYGIHADLANLIGTTVAQPDKRYLLDFWLHCQHPRLFSNVQK